MNRPEAVAVVEAYIAKMQKECSVEIEINHDITEERPLGYIFFYNSKEFWKTREFSASLVGNGPLLVLRSSGELSSAILSVSQKKYG
jgi:hypothetical protein